MHGAVVFRVLATTPVAYLPADTTCCDTGSNECPMAKHNLIRSPSVNKKIEKKTETSGGSMPEKRRVFDYATPLRFSITATSGNSTMKISSPRPGCSL